MKARLSLAAVFGLAALALSTTGGAAFGPTAAPTSANQIHVVVRGTDGALWHKWFDTATTTWRWESLNGFPTSDATIVSSATGQLDVFVRGKDNALWHKTWSGGWGAWGSIGGVLAGEPAAVISSPGVIDVFAQGADGGLWDSHFDARGQQWVNLGGRLTSAPVAVSSSEGQADAFVRGADGAVWRAMVIGATSLAHEWEPVGGRIIGSPAAVAVSGQLDVFVEGADAAMWWASKIGATNWNWSPLGGRLSASPWAAATGSGTTTPLVLVRGTDRQLWQWDGTWRGLGGSLAFRPTAATLNGAVHAFVQGADDTLWHEWGSGNWENLGGQLTRPPCGAPANPWGYTLCGGSFVYAPPANFCSVFFCLASFWSSANGYVAQCYDGAFSHSGGQPGDCADHLGEFRPLWGA